MVRRRLKMLMALLAFTFWSHLNAAQKPATPEMIWIKGGDFFLGDSLGNADERPVHKIKLADFYLAKTEITLAHFAEFVMATGYSTDAEKGNGSFVWGSSGWSIQEGVFWRCDELGALRPKEHYSYPVLHVSWMDAAHYCNWMSIQMGLKKVFDFQQDTVFIDPFANGFRLPTEAEWEFAAAEGKYGQKPRFSGGNDLESLAWYSGNAQKRVHAVAQKNANKLGLYDLTGNVWEWCLDHYTVDYHRRSIGERDSFGPLNSHLYVLRGGSWHNNANHCRITNRTSRYADTRDGNIGFRVARGGK